MRAYSQLNYTMLYIAALINAPVRGGKRLSSCRHYSKREAASISVHTIRQGENFGSVCVMSDDKKNDVRVRSDIHYARSHHSFRGATEWIIRHAIVSHSDLLYLGKQDYRLNSNCMIGNMGSRDFGANYVTHYFSQ